MSLFALPEATTANILQRWPLHVFSLLLHPRVPVDSVHSCWSHALLPKKKKICFQIQRTFFLFWLYLFWGIFAIFVLMNKQLYSLNPWVKDAISPCWIKHTLKLIQSILMTQVDYSMECRITLTWSTIPLEKYKSLDFKKGLSLYTISYSSKTLIWWK